MLTNKAEDAVLQEVDALLFKRAKLNHCRAQEKSSNDEAYENLVSRYDAARELIAEFLKKNPQDEKVIDVDANSTVLLTIQNNMCGGGGFRQDMQHLIKWSAVKDTIIGKRFGQHQPDFLYVSSDMSVPSEASSEDKQVDACIRELLDQGCCIYDAELDNTEGENLLVNIKAKKDVAAPSRFVIYRSFS